MLHLEKNSTFPVARPVKLDTVSQPLNEWKNGRAHDLSPDVLRAGGWAGISSEVSSAPNIHLPRADTSYGQRSVPYARVQILPHKEGVMLLIFF